jgi:hypothetical protein
MLKKMKMLVTKLFLGLCLLAFLVSGIELIIRDIMSDLERTQIVDELVAGLAAKGLAIVPASLVDDAIQLQKARNRMLKRDKLTPYEVAKFKLLPGAPSLSTVKNMSSDGRINDAEAYEDKSGKQYITRACIERLNSQA